MTSGQAHHAAAPSYLAILSRFDSRITASLSGDVLPGASSTSVEASRIAPSPSTSEALPEVETEASALPPEENGDSIDMEHTNRPHPAFLAPSEPSEQDFSPEPAIEAKLTAEGRPCVPLLAFTATWHRADGLALGKVFEKIVWHGDWLDMIRGRW